MANKTITKQYVKDYIEISNKDLLDVLKDSIDLGVDWKNFKDDLISALVKYANNPTTENMNSLNLLISSNYTSSYSLGKDTLEQMLIGLDKNDKEIQKNNKSRQETKKDEKYYREIYKELGLDYDFTEKIEAHYEELKAENDGTKRVKKVKKVSDKEFNSNKQLIETTSQKIDVLIEKLENDKKSIDIKSVPDEFKQEYDKMQNGNLSKNEIEEFEEKLSQKFEDNIKKIRDQLNILQGTKVKEELLTLLKNELPDSQDKDLRNEVSAFLDSIRVDQDGKLIYPKNSRLTKLLEDSNLSNNQTEIIEKLKKYCSVPKISELTDEEIQNLGSNLQDPTKLNTDSKEYRVAMWLKNNQDMLPVEYYSVDKLFKIIDDVSKDNTTIDLIMKSTELSHKLIILGELKEQFSRFMDAMLEYEDKDYIYNHELTGSEEKGKRVLIDEATCKVKRLESAGLKEVILNGENSSNSVLKSAESILIEDLENARQAHNKECEIYQDYK